MCTVAHGKRYHLAGQWMVPSEPSKEWKPSGLPAVGRTNDCLLNESAPARKSEVARLHRTSDLRYTVRPPPGPKHERAQTKPASTGTSPTRPAIRCRSEGLARFALATPVGVPMYAVIPPPATKNSSRHHISKSYRAASGEMILCLTKVRHPAN